MHIDASWCNPNIFEDPKKTTRRINPKSIDNLDLWMKCLKDEGIYIWLELNYERRLTEADGVSVGYDEIKRSSTGMARFSYFNQDVRRLMLEFQHQFLNHVNRYTRQAYKDDPAVVGVLITNETDLTTHYGNLMLPDHKNPVHNAIFTKEYKEFARRTGLPEDRTWRTWEPGPSKVFLNDMEHRFNLVMIEDLRKLGVRAPLATTDAWAGPSQFSLPALTDGDIIDAHSYGEAEALSANPHYEPNFVASIGIAQVQDRPLAITEWNTPVPTVDRFTSPLYVASIASLQGWDMPMVFGYSQIPLSPLAKHVDQWSIYNDPCLGGLMPAAALAFRQGHISPARKKYCMMLNRAQLFDQAINPVTSVAVRTLMEQSRLTTGFPVVKELPWLQPTQTPSDATIVTDPDHDYIPKGQTFVRSDTGELLRDWKQGIQTIDTPKTQAVAGWIGGRTLDLSDVAIRIDTRKAVVALSAIDDQPLSTSRDILITAVARAVPTDTNHVPYLSEPVVGTVTLRTKTTGLQLLALESHGKVVERLEPKVTSDGLTIHIPTKRGTHWYALRTSQQSK